MNANREKKKNELDRILRIAFRNLGMKPTKAERMKAYENEIRAIFKNKNLGNKK